MAKASSIHLIKPKNRLQAQDNTGIIAVANLNENKISADEAFVFIEDATWGVWFGNGSRNLATSVHESLLSDDYMAIYPNPSTDVLNISLSEYHITNYQ